MSSGVAVEFVKTANRETFLPKRDGLLCANDVQQRLFDQTINISSLRCIVRFPSSTYLALDTSDWDPYAVLTSTR
jgi:hypothetical protein